MQSEIATESVRGKIPDASYSVKSGAGVPDRAPGAVGRGAGHAEAAPTLGHAAADGEMRRGEQEAGCTAADLHLPASARERILRAVPDNTRRAHLAVEQLRRLVPGAGAGVAEVDTSVHTARSMQLWICVAAS